MKKILILACLSLLGQLFFSRLHATHLMGVDISYECINQCTIRIHFRGYRDCGGASGIGIQQFAFTAAPGCTLPNALGPWTPAGDGSSPLHYFVTEVTPVCPGTITQCQNPGSSIRGVEEYYRFRDYNICGLNCTDFNITWTGQNRNAGITSGAASQGLGVFVTSLNTALSPCNNSPYFAAPPTPYVCQGDTFVFNQGAIDPDGDSLAYSLGPCFTDAGVQVNYNPGFSPTVPLGPTWNVTVNPITGDVTFLPTPGSIQVGVMCVYVEEWRNGVLLNQIVRDMQVNVIPCPSNTSPRVPSVSNISGGTGSGGSGTGIRIATCIGNTLCFDLPTNDPNVGDTVTMWWNFGIPTGSFFQTNNPTITDTIVGVNPRATFCWTPSAAGTFSFVVNLRDNACPSYGSSQFTVTITVSNPTVNPQPGQDSCGTVDFCALPGFGGIPPYSYNWTGSGGLSSNDSCFSHSFPGNGVFPYTLVLTDSAGCRDTVTGSVTINVSINANAGPDLSYCHGDSVQIGGPPSPNETYSWTPTTGLTDPNSSSTMVNLTNTGTTPITQQYILEVFNTVSQCEDFDTVNITVFPIPEAEFTLDSTGCLGEATNIVYTGFNGNGANYSWTFGNGATPATSTTRGPHSVSWNTPGVKYVTLTVSQNGCTSPTYIDSIDIRDVPVLSIQEYQVNCNGNGDGAADVDAVGGFGGYTYTWSNGSPNDSIFGLNGGTYIVTVTDASGCEVIDTAQVFEPPVLNINPIVTDISCFGGTDGSVVTNVTGGNGNYSYLWNPGGQTSSSIINLTQGDYIVVVTDTSSLGFLCQYTDTLTIVEPTQLTLVIAGTNISCNGGSNGTATVTPSGATPPYSYQWSGTPGQTTQSATNLTAGTWSVTVTDSRGCQENISITLTEPTVLTLQGVHADVTCFGANDGSATVNASGATPPYNYAWNTTPAQSTPTAVNLPGGLFVVTVTDANGCMDSVAYNVIEPSQVGTFIQLTNVSCFGGNDGSLTAVPSGGVGNYLFEWIPGGQTTPTLSNLTVGTYTVVVTDGNGCTDTTNASVYQPALLEVDGDSIPTRCWIPGDDGIAQAIVTGGIPPYTYSWNTTPVQTTAWATGLPAGTYTVTVTDANGCVAIHSVDVTEIRDPIVTAGPDTSFCEGSGGAQIFASGQLGTTPYYYQWWCNQSQTFCGLDSVFDNDPIANPNVTTTYYVQITDFNGCVSNVDSLVVTVLPKPIVDAGLDFYLCTDSAPCQILNPTITGAPGPYQYQWSPSTGLSNDTIANPCARPDTTTIYTLQVVASNGCASFYNTVDTNSTIIVNVSPLPIADAGPDRSICFGDTTELQGYGFGAGPVYNYQWSPAVSLSDSTIPNPWAWPGFTTEYILTVWSNGCPSYGDTVRVDVHTIPTNDAGPDVEICLGGEALLDGQAGGDSTSNGYTFQWWDNTGVIGSTNVEDLQASPDTTHTYYMVATSSWGCESPVDSATVYVKPSPFAEAGSQQRLCAGDSIQLNGSYYYTTTDTAPNASQVWFAWTPSSSLSDTTIANPWAYPTQSGFYYLTVQYNTCTHTDSVLITLFPDVGATASADTNVICQLDSVQFNSAGGLGGASFTWIPSTGLSDPNIPNPLASPDTSTVYTLIVSEGGCADTLLIPLEVLPTPNPNYLSSIVEGCQPHTVSFLSNSDDAIAYVWNFGDGEVSNFQDPVHTYNTPGYYVVTLTAVSIGGCKATIDDITIHVLDTAIVDFTSNPNYPVILSLPNTSVNFFETSSNVNDWLWTFGDGDFSTEINPVHTYTQPGEYFVTLEVNNHNGCRSQVTHGPYVIMTPDLFIPNVFTPNGDGINDTWMVQYTGSQYFFATIMDRWGARIYEGRNKMQGWDGNNLKGERVPEGVYYYYVKTGDREFSGEVTLLR